MKKITLVLILCLFAQLVKSQNTSVEKSTFGIQTGFLGVWVHNESRLSNQIALRSEIGLSAGIYGGDLYGKSGFFMIPTITLEPRWYYNLEKRNAKSRRTDGNSGNFISIKTSYNADVLLFESDPNINFISDISIVPTWGIRRHIGNYFTYETGIGVGYIHIFREQNTFIINEPDVAVNLHLRLGYRF